MGRRVRIIAEATPHDYTQRFASLMPEGTARKGRRLEDYREEFGGSLEGDLEDPFGGVERISLEPLSDTPPGHYVKISFHVAPEGEDFAPDHKSDGIVLKEYVLPEGTPVPGTP